MNSGWSSDFSYGYFRLILEVIKSNFELHLLSQAPRIPDTIRQPKLILRHDVDVSLKRALKMAEIENEFGVNATYMVITNSPLYCLDDKTSRDMFQQLITLGHEVGLHFDLDDDERNSNCEISVIETKIYSACKQLEKIINLPVRSISFHRPMQAFLQGPLVVCERINAYSQKLMVRYLSDSKGCWRIGEPLLKLSRPDNSLIQLLIHPIWWSDEHLSPEDRLQEFFDTETQGQSPQYVKAFDIALANTIPAVRRGGFCNKATEERNNETGKIQYRC